MNEYFKSILLAKVSHQRRPTHSRQTNEFPKTANHSTTLKKGIFLNNSFQSKYGVDRFVFRNSEQLSQKLEWRRALGRYERTCAFVLSFHSLNSLFSGLLEFWA